mmetsp:Transcript_10434/g.20879  ORF Transcript_10434/g.20879 Transcript_10434/m.20879 type:complete len:124 (-) Transcript_10434:193-564(-)|eukprot:CAMPEP_0181317892 /NCGR_PEP_ID=MMETSP1101-20121128/16711_1 /TAXON_ID=46948 /ORGANISM="Rhodomonas abbreviata, Strain Caron Lab Isolate" /LENGTH=123 /DNA_ID=CAMNT_0023425317 /DNA_START=264 /DNA_END=635 /DNA_ORIENTATION=+
MAKAQASKFAFWVITWIGIIVLCHAGYSTIQYRKYLRLVGEEFVSSPADIYLEVLLGFLISFFGVINMSEELLPIRMAETYYQKTVDDTNFRPEFMSFNHRGRVLGTLMDCGDELSAGDKKRQ